MRNATYNDIQRLLDNRQPFTGNSASAKIDGFGNYQVYSYQTLIATWHNDGKIYLDGTKYSTTTSRLQNLIRKAWGLN